MMRCVSAIFAFLLCVIPVRAVILYGGSGTGNTTAPTDDPGWANVGSVNGASGVYIGSYASGYWVLTASHVGAGNITLGGTTYNAVAGSGVQVAGDLYAFRIASNPSLPNLTLSSTAPALGSTAVMIGNGRNRATTSTTWYVDIDTNPYTWSTSNFAGADTTASGYAYATGNSKRWGTNTIDAVTTYNIGTGVTTAFSVDFDAVTGQSQGAPGDSGGAFFYKNGSTWELAGILGAIATFSGQPANTAIVGNLTYAVDIAAYSGLLASVMTAIPEPSAVALALGAAALGMATIRRRRPRAN